MNNELNRAISFATIAHRRQKRKGSKLPYIIHPYSMALYLQSKGCKQEVIIAALFHDILEDTIVGEKKIKEQFGAEVLAIVKACTENKILSWQKRKLESFEKYEHASEEILLVSMTDKMHNMFSILEDYPIFGEKIWNKFSKQKSDYNWYYSKLNSIFDKRAQTATLKSVYIDFNSVYSDFQQLFI